MRISNSVQNLQPASFKGVEIEAFMQYPKEKNWYYMGVNFTEEDRKKAGEILGIRPNPKNKVFSVEMNIDTNATVSRTGQTGVKILDMDYDYADKTLKNVFRGYSSNRPEGAEVFAQLSELMQNATAITKNYLKDPENALKIVKEFFTVKK